MACKLLILPRELRDLILDYAIFDGQNGADDGLSCVERRSQRLTAGDERWQWNIEYTSQAHIPAYLGLMKTNRQLNFEVKEYIRGISEEDRLPAKMTMVLAYPDVTPTWTHMPMPPNKIDKLEILVKVDHMYHPAYMGQGPANAIARLVFEVLRRYLHRGPHLARATPLQEPLHLHTVEITLAPPQPLEEMTYVYGFPAEQLRILAHELCDVMRRLGRSGIVFGSVDFFKFRLEGHDWRLIPVTSRIWDEQDSALFTSGGYCWDAGDPFIRGSAGTL
ncbi:hypothetical protein LTR37_013109 [Vermiconidia calcicola]|uniref:Uncharacterized protein n=1 Tax=Vermiconidia calcicola TaxID=1690605 RepID=A0ACC3N092_9PEZI|nr:hypothetical protein LTR37_013109 [Vermiconidia calcicola]